MTKENYLWRKENLISAAKDFEVDCLDEQRKFYKSTILETEKKEIEGRTIEMAYVGFRVYRESTYRMDYKTDDYRGKYEGWSKKFDEWIPIYSPRIMPFNSQTSGKRKVE